MMASDLLSTPPPLAPPKAQAEMVSWLRLIRSRRVGISTFFRLMRDHGTATRALAALPGIANAAGVARYTPYTEEQAEYELALGRRTGAKLVFYGAQDYPAALCNISDPPPLIWTLGDPALLTRPAIALVGARNASSLGRRMAHRLAGGLAEAGFSVVSGLARGVDAAAHLAALEHGTIAVQAGGIDVIYPAENTQLHHDIAQRGLRVSEQPMGLQPMARHFPKRNRIISGLARAVIVVEAAAKSGSLITARNALDQGREVLVVPGHPFDGRSAGCNMLIRDGATLVRSVQDILEVVRIDTPPDASPGNISAPSDPVPEHPDHLTQNAILNLLGPSPVAEDQLIRDLKRPANQVTPHILALEMEGRIIRQPGGLLCRAAVTV
ncbi:MAG: DNA-protecting protein DprA [Litoreibacter sp.]|nr:DNA-protecting protein DprA [Litoreibacter sp.]